MKIQKAKRTITRTSKNLWRVLPIILATTLLVSFISAIIPNSFYTSIFGRNVFLNSLIGTTIGSISAGNPVTSYILGGELLKRGVSLIAVTAFIVAWVTVGIIQFPTEAAILGKRFAILRNATSFIFAILVGVATVAILGL